MSLYRELKRRNVFRVAIAYLAGSWLLVEVAETIFPLYGFGDTPARVIVTLLAIGFPLFLVFSWVFEITPEGLKLERDIRREESITPQTGKKLDRIIIVLLALALGYFAFDKFILDPTRDAELVEETSQQTRSDILVESYGDKSIAVLPFVNMSADPEQVYFSDGISEELLNLLAQIPELRVISRSSAFSFKGRDITIPEMAKQLNVAHILDGSVRKAGGRVRITTQLIEAHSDTHLWSETYDRELKDIFAVQEEIAAAVVDALQVEILGEKPKSNVANPKAYALYLQGIHIWRLAGGTEAEQVEVLLRRAVEIDPELASAWTELGYVYRVQATWGMRPVDEGIELARHAIQRALEINPKNGRAYAALAYVELELGWDFSAADQYMQRAMVLSPGDSRVLLVDSLLKQVFGRLDEAIDLQERAIALDPVVPRKYLSMGLLYYRAHRFDEAINAFHTAASLNPGRNVISHYGLYCLGLVRLAQGNALAALEEIAQLSGDYKVQLTAIVQHALGDAEASNAAIQELTGDRGTPDGYMIAQAHAFRGEIDQAFTWLDLAYDNQNPELILMGDDPLLANLHDDSRWERLIGKMGLPR